MTPALTHILLLLSVLAALLSLWSLLLWRLSRRQQDQYDASEIATHTNANQCITLVYASQTGTAQHYAEQTQQLFQSQGFVAELLALDQVHLPLLQHRQTILWLVSSYGDGDAPDHAQQFQHQLMAQVADLAHLRVAILGFGDRQYRDFCGFATRLEQWLVAANSHFLFAPVLVDAENQPDIQRWFSALETAFDLNDATMLPVQDSTEESAFLPCYLEQRDCLNTAFDGNLLHIRLAAPVDLHWQAGDCLEIKLPDTPSHASRFYSIANLPKQPAQPTPSAQNQPTTHSIELLVRLTEFSTNAGLGYGLGSGYLVQQLRVGDAVQARIHVNPSLYHLAQAKALWLIAAGTGLAGALAQLRARDALGQAQNVLLYGERQAENVQAFAHEIEHWLESGHLSHFELALSQQADGNHSARYVTDLLKAHRAAFLAHIQAGDLMYVCGRLDGLGVAVDALLVEWLGQSQVDEFKANHRYCRDVY